ncbi:MAG: hypothetical protein ABIH66_01910 [bacterium]
MEAKDIEKLNILLSHWIEHNESHIKSYADWAVKLEGTGLQDVGRLIGEAADTIARANEKFKQARETFDSLDKSEND